MGFVGFGGVQGFLLVVSRNTIGCWRSNLGLPVPGKLSPRRVRAPGPHSGKVFVLHAADRDGPGMASHMIS